MKPHRLIIVDIDQTLLNSPSQKVPSDLFVETVQRLYPKVLVGCATGRAYSWALPVLKAAHFTAPCIIAGGAAIVDQNTYEIISDMQIPSPDLIAIQSILAPHSSVRILFNDYSDSDYLKGGWDIKDFLSINECTVIDIIGLDHNLADQLISQFSALNNVHAVKMNGYNKDVVDILLTHKIATKTTAIEALRARLSIHKDATIGIGNGYNDGEIFDAVGFKVAVANAVDSLKQDADLIIDDVSTDPIPRYLNQLKFR